MRLQNYLLITKKLTLSTREITPTSKKGGSLMRSPQGKNAELFFQEQVSRFATHAHRLMSLGQWNVTPHDHKPFHHASTCICCTRLCATTLQGTYSNNSAVLQLYTAQNVSNSALRNHKKTINNSFPSFHQCLLILQS